MATNLQALNDGDTGFIGANYRLNPDQVPQGFVSEAENCTFDRGVIRPRKGYKRPVWAKQVFDELLSPVFDAFAGDILGVGLFSNPNGDEFFLVATNEGTGRVWALRNGNAAREIPLNGFSIWSPVEFVQGFNAMMLLREGPDRIYFTGGTQIDPSTDQLTLPIPPLFTSGARIRFVDTALNNGETSVIGLESGKTYIMNVLADNVVEFFANVSDFEAEGAVIADDIVIDDDVTQLVDDLGNLLVTSTNQLGLSDGTGTFYLERADQLNEFDPNEANAPILIMQEESEIFEAFDSGATTARNVTNALRVGFKAVPLDLFFDDDGVDIIEDTLEVINHRFVPGDSVIFEMLQTALPGGISEGVTYFVSPDTPHRFRIHLTQDAALAYMRNPDAGAADRLDITGLAGTGQNFLVRKTTAGLLSIPPASTGVFFADRLWVPYSRDLMAASDIGDPLHFQPFDNFNLRVNTGSSDSIVAIYPFNKTTLLVFKQNSVHAIINAYGDLKDIVVVELTREYGCAAKRTIAAAGKDVVFLSQNGVTTIQQTESNELQGVVLPLSESIQPLIDDVDSLSISNAAAVYHDNRYLLSVPVNGSTSGDNVEILVYNFLNGAWEGRWTSLEQRAKYFVRGPVNGKLRALFADYNGFINLMNEGFTDESSDIPTVVKTRGYTGQVPTHKHWNKAEIDISTWSPNFSVTSSTDGVNEDRALIVGRTKDRTKFYTYNSTDYDPTNINDDHGNPFRQDYSILTDSAGFVFGTNGADIDAHQRTVEKVRLRQSGKTIQLLITGQTGRIEIQSVVVEGVASRTSGSSIV